jgi:FKBP-type peptidyl-prolyl cis-trans isomerase FkpA
MHAVFNVNWYLMSKRFLVVGSLVLVAGVVAGMAGIWYIDTQSKEEDSVLGSNDVIGSPQPLSSGPTSSNSTENSNTRVDTSVINAGNTQNNTGNSLRVNDNNQKTSNNTSQSINADAAPTLAELGQYGVEYLNSETALFGDLRKGDGAEAIAGKTITVDYRGWLVNGQIFDESYKTGRHFSFVLGKGQVISGWDQAISGMKVGGKRRLIIPPKAGYGSSPVGGIPANSLLVFDVELLGIQ